MIIQTIELENFKSYGEPQLIDLTSVDATSISGPNGAGKSSIIEALTFALYGRSTATERKELGNEALIRDGQEEGRVAATFEKDGHTYRVERTATRRGPGKATLSSELGKTLQAGPINVSKMVESIVGMDYETFVSSTIMRQDEMDRITSLRPGERKEILSKIFGLELYEKLKKTTHEKRIKAKADLEASEKLTEQLSNTIANEKEVVTGLKEAKASSERLHATITKEQEQLETLAREIKAAIQKKSQYDKQQTNLEAIERETKTTKAHLETTVSDIKSAREAAKSLDELTKELKKGKQVEEERDQAQKLKEKLNGEISEQEERMRSIKKAITEEQEHFNTITGSKKAECPVCKQPLDEAHKTKVLDQYDTRLKELKQEHEESDKNCLTNRNTLEKEVLPRLAELERQVKSRQKYEVEKARQEAIASRLPKLLETEKELKAKISEATDAKQKATSQLEILRGSVVEFERLESKRTTLSERLAKLREDRATAESSIKYLTAELEQITDAKKKLARIRLEVGTQTELIPIYEILEEAFSKDGIPTAILKDLVPEVEEEASRILRDLSNGRMNVNFRFGRQTGRDTVTDELVVEAEDTTGLHPVTRFSGGERMRINLALRLGISEIIAKRSGYKGKIETLIIDEGFGALDEEGRQATIEILRQLRQRFQKIMIISHIEEVKDAFDSKLVVSKTTGGQSIVEVI